MAAIFKRIVDLCAAVQSGEGIVLAGAAKTGKTHHALVVAMQHAKHRGPVVVAFAGEDVAMASVMAEETSLRMAFCRLISPPSWESNERVDSACKKMMQLYPGEPLLLVMTEPPDWHHLRQLRSKGVTTLAEVTTLRGSEDAFHRSSEHARDVIAESSLVVELHIAAAQVHKCRREV